MSNLNNLFGSNAEVPAGGNVLLAAKQRRPRPAPASQQSFPAGGSSQGDLLLTGRSRRQRHEAEAAAAAKESGKASAEAESSNEVSATRQVHGRVKAPLRLRRNRAPRGNTTEKEATEETTRSTLTPRPSTDSGPVITTPPCSECAKLQAWADELEMQLEHWHDVAAERQARITALEAEILTLRAQQNMIPSAEVPYPTPPPPLPQPPHFKAPGAAPRRLSIDSVEWDESDDEELSTPAPTSMPRCQTVDASKEEESQAWRLRMEAWVCSGSDLRGLMETLPTVLPRCCRTAEQGYLLPTGRAATDEELKRAYRKALLSVHPDKLKSGISETERAHASDVFAVLSEAAHR